VQTWRRLAKQKVGLIGPCAIQRELHKVSTGKSIPSLSTIERVLRKRGLVAQSNQAKWYIFRNPCRWCLAACVLWTFRYLEDGPKVYAFHTLNWHTRDCTQTIASDKNYETV
jgi:hypothetical protein